MDIDPQLCALASIMLGGAELRMSVAKLSARIDTLDLTKADKPGFRRLPLAVAAGFALLAIYGAVMVDPLQSARSIAMTADAARLDTVRP